MVLEGGTAQARQSTIPQLVDDAMAGIERDDPGLKGVPPKDYARRALDKTRLGQFIDLITNIKVGDEESRAKDVLGRVYEYFLSRFASAEGKKGWDWSSRVLCRELRRRFRPHGHAQHAAAHDPGQQVRVVAGPGTGKSSAIEERIDRLGPGPAVPPWRLSAQAVSKPTVISGWWGGIPPSDCMAQMRWEWTSQKSVQNG